MKCPRCQTNNPDGTKFCENCGQALERRCPNCNNPVAATAKFCGTCGFALAAPAVSPTPIAAPPAASSNRLEQYIPKELMAKLEAARSGRSMQGERRIVTVLFCDVKGSTALAEQLDPEEWAEIMSGAFQYLIQPVYRYEGTLARLMGDAILAFFGAPIAHEDDPQRAVLAGLGILDGIQPYRQQLQRKYGLDFNVRVGINTGLVVVGEVGSDLRVEYTAMGDAVNLAARMEQTAAPGSVQVSAGTYKAIAPLFDVEALGGIEVKGHSEPVAAYRVLSRKAQPGRLRGIEGLDAPMIGREREFALLQQAFADVQQGRGQVISVMGEAGLGKSRLIAELRQWATAEFQFAQPNEATSTIRGWYEGRSLSYETTIPYTPFRDLFSRLFNLRLDQNDTQKYSQIKTALATLSPELAANQAPFFAAMFEIKPTGSDADLVKYLEPPALREKVFSSIMAVIEHLAAAQPTVLVFEDLHWADSTSLDLIERLMALTDQTCLMLLAVFRPQRQDPSWRFHEVASRDYAHRYTTVMLEPLNEAKSRELVANLLHVEDLPEKVRALILKKAEGNPFFVEEVIRSLLDARLIVRENSHWRATREIENISLPDTLAGVITARLDRLDEDAKRAAQTAAVIGREFQFETLTEIYDTRPVLDKAIGELQRRELVREKSRLPRRVYLFKHALTQETAYGSILLSIRRDLHRRIAECLERTERERVNDIARHFTEARDFGRALPFLVEAGERAAHAYATPEAIGYLTRAKDLLKTIDNTDLARRIYEGLGGALSLASQIPAAAETYQEMHQYAQAHDDIPMQISALNKMAMVTALRLGDFQGADKHLTDAERLAQENGELAGLGEMFYVRCVMCTSTADFSGAVHHLGESVRIGRELNIKEQLAFGLEHTSNTLMLMTRFEEGWAAAQEGLQIAQEIGNLANVANIKADSMAGYHLWKGDLSAALALAVEGTNLAHRIGVAMSEAGGSLQAGSIAGLRGEYQSASEYFRRGIPAGQQSGYPFMMVMPMAGYVANEVEMSGALSPEGQAWRDEALQTLETPFGMPAAAVGYSFLGHAALAQGEIDKAHGYYQKGLLLPSPWMNLQKPEVLVGLARVAIVRGQLDEAEQRLAEARTYSEERDMKKAYPQIALASGLYSMARGNPEQALAEYARAEALAMDMQMRPVVMQARIGAARSLAALGRTDEAEAKRREAQAMVSEIAGLFTDEAMRAAFSAHAERQIENAMTAPATTASKSADAGDSDCPHLEQIQDVVRSSDGCEECLKMGDTWVHLRMCMICGNVGCCDNSKNKHATKHYRSSGHPIMKSLEPDENWMWCYVDQLAFETE
ncbi:MAG: AAA family ATPase [Chloroflexi bacterium]|nr:AAA family ATPase [Chloroflexota bacterium]